MQSFAPLFLIELKKLDITANTRIFTGTYNGTPITICSHGVGSAGASVAFHELFVGGVKTIMRAGTCGAMQKSIKDGDVIIATGNPL